MEARVLNLPVDQPMHKPEPEQFWQLEDFKKYNDAIWYCVVEIIEKDYKMIGRYGERYDNKLKARIEALSKLIFTFRRHGLIDANPREGRKIGRILEILNI